MKNSHINTYIINCDEMAKVQCARVCQTEIALVPNSPLTDLYNIITYIDQEKINEDAVRVIDIPQNGRQRSMIPVSKFGLTDHSRSEEDNLNLREELLKTSIEETFVQTNQKEEMSCQTDLMIAPHILNDDEQAVITMNSSCQTCISCSPSVSLTNLVPQLEKYVNYGNDDQKELYKNAAEMLTDIVHDVITIPQRIFEPVIMKPVLRKTSETSCSTDNSEWDTVISDGSNSIQDKSDDGFSNVDVDNSSKENILFYESNVSEISSIHSLDCATNIIEEDLMVPAVKGENNIGNNQNNEENRNIKMSSVDLSID